MTQRLVATCLLVFAVTLWSWVFNRPDPRPVVIPYILLIDGEATEREIDAIRKFVVASGGSADEPTLDFDQSEIMFVNMSVSVSNDLRKMPAVMAIETGGKGMYWDVPPISSNKYVDAVLNAIAYGIDWMRSCENPTDC